MNVNLPIAALTESLSALNAAGNAGLGVTCRTRIGVEAAGVDGPRAELPPLPPVFATVAVRDGAGAAVQRLRDLVTTSITGATSRAPGRRASRRRWDTCTRLPDHRRWTYLVKSSRPDHPYRPSEARLSENDR